MAPTNKRTSASGKGLPNQKCHQRVPFVCITILYRVDDKFLDRLCRRITTSPLFKPSPSPEFSGARGTFRSSAGFLSNYISGFRAVRNHCAAPMGQDEAKERLKENLCQTANSRASESFAQLVCVGPVACLFVEEESRARASETAPSRRPSLAAPMAFFPLIAFLIFPALPHASVGPSWRRLTQTIIRIPRL